MPRKTPEQWQIIFKDQENSGLSIPEYCRQHNINITTFYNRRAKLALNKQRQLATTSATKQSPTGFVQVKPAMTFEQPQAAIILNTRQAQLQLPATVSPQWVGQVLRELNQ